MGMPQGAAEDAVKFYFDEHVHPAVAAYLRKHSIDVLTAQEAGRAGQGVSDAEQLAFATANGRVLVTSDNDFLNPRIVPQLASGQHAGVVRLLLTVGVGGHSRYLRYIALTETAATAASRIFFSQLIADGLFPGE